MRSAASAVRTEMGEVLDVIRQRAEARGELWPNSGASGMAVHVMAKAERMFMAVLQRQENWREVVIAEGPDLLAYTSFLLAQAREGTLDGQWPWAAEEA